MERSRGKQNMTVRTRKTAEGGEEARTKDETRKIGKVGGNRYIK